eukprot:6226989-Alexandrium_andersonii.AAC.1
MFSVTNIVAAWSRSSVGVRGDSSHVRALVHEASLFVFVLRQGWATSCVFGRGIRRVGEAPTMRRVS